MFLSIHYRHLKKKKESAEKCHSRITVADADVQTAQNEILLQQVLKPGINLLVLNLCAGGLLKPQNEREQPKFNNLNLHALSLLYLHTKHHIN